MWRWGKWRYGDEIKGQLRLFVFFWPSALITSLSSAASDSLLIHLQTHRDGDMNTMFSAAHRALCRASTFSHISKTKKETRSWSKQRMKRNYVYFCLTQRNVSTNTAFTHINSMFVVFRRWTLMILVTFDLLFIATSNHKVVQVKKKKRFPWNFQIPLPRSWTTGSCAEEHARISASSRFWRCSV